VDVVVVTQSRLDGRRPPETPYAVVRAPRRRELAALLGRCDLLHAACTSLAVLAAARRVGVPIVLTHSSFSPAMQHRWREPRSFLAREEAWRVLHAQASRLAMRAADRNVCLSETSLRMLRPPRGLVVHPPVAVGSVYRPLPDVTRTARFAFVGRLVVHKGCDVLLRALAYCRRRGHPLELDVYGDGPERERLVRLARECGLDEEAVAFHGVVEGDDLARAYNRAFAVVVPSVWHEPLGLVAVEAMACGRAVVASASGGLGEVVAGTGLTCPPGDDEALADRLIELQTRPELRAGCERGGLELAGRFSPDAIGGEYLALYDAVVAA
jgi:glycosyltransferase involved in cell wall biosynthesis